MHTRIYYAILLLLTVPLYSCGGGGGGGNSAASPPTGIVPQPPPVPSPIYQGLTTPAALSPFIAGQVTKFVLADVDLAISFSANLINPFLSTQGSGSINASQPGPAGGEATLTGYVNSQYSAWVVEKLVNYAFVPSGTNTTVTLNGQLLVDVSGDTVTFGYTDYSEQGAGFNITLSGSASQQAVSGNQSNNGLATTTTTLNLGIIDHIAGVDEEFLNFTLNSANGNLIANSIDRTFTGRVYDSDVGYLDMSTQGTEIYSTDPTQQLPIYGADVMVTGSNNTTPLLIGPLNYYFFAVGISTSNNGIFDASARYSWNNFSLDTTPAPVGTGPVAVAVEATSPAVGTPISLDGRFSHSPNGDYLQMHWSLLYETPGSHPVLANAGLPEATLTVDKAGDYLVLLTVTDGSQSSDATVVVSVTPVQTPTESSPMFQSVPGGDVTGQIGTPVQLDGRAGFDMTDETPPTYTWKLIAPAGSAATLSDPTSAQPSFTPDVPGYYHVVLQPTSPDLGISVSPSLYSLTVTVDEPIAFRPPVFFDGSELLLGGPTLQVADINGDGRPDMLYSQVDDNYLGAVNVYLNAGNGVFEAPLSLTVPGSQYESEPVLADINGDGRLDVIETYTNNNNANAVAVFLQNPDGSFAAPASYSYSTFIGVINPVAVGHLFGSSVLSVITLDTYGNLYNFTVNSNGSLQSPGLITLPTSAWGDGSSLSLVDFNGDSLADLIGNGDGGSAVLDVATASENFAPFNGQAIYADAAAVGNLYGDGHNELVLAGSAAAQVFSESGVNPVSYPLSTAEPVAVAFGDVNGDGLTDIVVLHDAGPGFLFQQANHTFSSEVLFPIDDPYYAVGPLWVGDLNGDGIPDLVYGRVVQFGYKPN